MSLAAYLKQRSQDICTDNKCDLENGEHNCESYAYIAKTDTGLQLLDICLPDYFSGTNYPYAAIPLPFEGTQRELERMVRNKIGNIY